MSKCVSEVGTLIFGGFDKSVEIVKKQKYVNRKLESYMHDKHVVISSNHKRIACS